MPIAVAAIVFAIVLFAPPVLNDGDTWSHIAVGRWILHSGAVPWTDPFSLTFTGRPWMAHEWLSEVAMAIAHRLGGVSGVLILTGLAAALAVWLLVRHLSIWLQPLPALVVLIFGTACGAASVLARPHILALPALELWTAGLLIARHGNVRPSWWLLPVMALWANLHGSFVFGLALVVPLGLEASLADRVVRWDWIRFFAVAIAAALLTPYGWHGLVDPLRLLSLGYLDHIGEWRGLDFSTPQPLEIALLALLYVCLSRGVRIPTMRLLLVMALLHMALHHTRHGLLAGIVGALVLAEPLARVVNPTAGRAHRGRAWPAAGFGLLVVLAAIRLGYPAVLPDGVSSPVTALSRVSQQTKTGPVFNDYAFGGLLMFEGIRPFIDARAELYGDEFIAGYLAMVRPDPAALEAVLRRYAITWTILAPASPAVTVLDGLPGWRRSYADRFAVVHTRVMQDP